MTYPFTRRELLRAAAVLPAGAAWGGRTRPESIALETYARRSYNYYNRMVDRDGLPYFNIFWEHPAEAAKPEQPAPQEPPSSAPAPGTSLPVPPSPAGPQTKPVAPR